MDCSQIRQHINAVGFQLDEAAAAHIRYCELCRHWFREAQLEVALKLDPVPVPSADFADRAIAKAARLDSAPRQMGGGAVDHGSRRLAALAAGLLLAVTAAFGWLAMPSEDHPPATAEAHLVKVVIDAKDHRQGARLILDLSEGLQLEGFGEQRHIEWQTDLVKGRNLLALPVQVKAGSRGDLRVALSYNGNAETELRVPVDA